MGPPSEVRTRALAPRVTPASHHLLDEGLAKKTEGEPLPEYRARLEELRKIGEEVMTKLRNLAEKEMNAAIAGLKKDLEPLTTAPADDRSAYRSVSALGDRARQLRRTRGLVKRETSEALEGVAAQAYFIELTLANRILTEAIASKDHALQANTNDLIQTGTASGAEHGASLASSSRPR